MNKQGNEKMGRVVVDVELANYKDLHRAEEGTLAPEKVRRIHSQGVVDTGATRLVLPESVVKQLGLPFIGDTKVRYADGRSTSRQRVEDVRVLLQGREGTFDALVEPDRTDVLIGAIVLESLDFLVDCQTRQLVPRDPNVIISEVESLDE